MALNKINTEIISKTFTWNELFNIAAVCERGSVFELPGCPQIAFQNQAGNDLVNFRITGS